MKKLLLGVITVLCAYNLFFIEIDASNKIYLQKIEAMAGCESPVQNQKGLGHLTRCFNESDGSHYTSYCCDFDSNYSENCEGRVCDPNRI